MSLPAFSVDNATLARELEVSSDWIESRSGIRQRFVATSEETTISLAEAAAKEALQRTPGFVPDLLLFVTFTPERWLCPRAPELAERLKLRGVGAFDVNAACAGAAVGLLTAISYLHGGLAHRVLLVCSAGEHFEYPDFQGVERFTCTRRV